MCNKTTFKKLVAIKTQIKILKEEEKLLVLKVKEHLADSGEWGEEVIKGDFKMKASTITKNMFNKDKLKVDYPEIFSEYLYTKDEDKLTIKEIPVLN